MMLNHQVMTSRRTILQCSFIDKYILYKKKKGIRTNEKDHKNKSTGQQDDEDDKEHTSVRQEEDNYSDEDSRLF